MAYTFAMHKSDLVTKTTGYGQKPRWVKTSQDEKSTSKTTQESLPVFARWA